MAKIIYKGLKENGLVDAEVKRTPVLITELIENITKGEGMCQMAIVHALEDIRKSAELDQRITQGYVNALAGGNLKKIKITKSEKKDEEEKCESPF